MIDMLTQSSNRKQRSSILLTIIVLCALLLPFVPLFIYSFSERWLFPALLPAEWGDRAWSYLFLPQTKLWAAFWDSLRIGVAVTTTSLIAGLPAGRALGLSSFRGKTLVEFLILAPAIVPAFAPSMGIHTVFIRLGLADTMAGVILVHLIPVLPYVVLVFAGIFANYSVEEEEGARTLGAHSWQVFWYVTLPSVWPGVMVAGFYAFTISWSQYLLTLLIGGGQVLTLPILLMNFINSGDYAIASALSLLFILPAVLMLLVTSRYLTGRNADLGGYGKI